MAKLSQIELNTINEATDMYSGYVLDFTNTSFSEFFCDEFGIDIYDEKYNSSGGSKGKRLRAFLRLEPPSVVANVLKELWKLHVDRLERRSEPGIPGLPEKFRAIVERLEDEGQPAQDIFERTFGQKPPVPVTEVAPGEFLVTPKKPPVMQTAAQPQTTPIDVLLSTPFLPTPTRPAINLGNPPETCLISEEAVRQAWLDQIPKREPEAAPVVIRGSVVILTALPVEFDAVHSHITDIRQESHDAGTIYDTGIFETETGIWYVGLVEAGKGNSRAAIETANAINHFKPSVVMFVGVAGGIKDVELGDIVAADRIYMYEAGKAEEGELLIRSSEGRSSYRMVQQARATARLQKWQQRVKNNEFDTAPSAYIGPIAGGEQVIASTRSDTYKLIRRYYSEAVAVEMEGRGFLEAAYTYQEVKSIVIRGISDLIDDKEQSDKSKWQEKAASNAAAFAFELLNDLNLPA